MITVILDNRIMLFVPITAITCYFCCNRYEEPKKQEQPQPSTSYQARRPSGPPLQSRPLEKLPDFDEASGATWIYPVNYPLREYQYSMVENALLRNTLISLPTGKWTVM